MKKIGNGVFFRDQGLSSMSIMSSTRCSYFKPPLFLFPDYALPGDSGGRGGPGRRGKEGDGRSSAVCPDRQTPAETDMERQVTQCTTNFLSVPRETRVWQMCGTGKVGHSTRCERGFILKLVTLSHTNRRMFWCGLPSEITSKKVNDIHVLFRISQNCPFQLYWPKLQCNRVVCESIWTNGDY